MTTTKMRMKTKTTMMKTPADAAEDADEIAANDDDNILCSGNRFQVFSGLITMKKVTLEYGEHSSSKSEIFVKTGNSKRRLLFKK